MFRRGFIARACACLGASSALALGATLEFNVDVAAGPLSTRLEDLERQTGIELLYDGDVIREVDAPAVSGSLTIGLALEQMLEGSGLTLRQAASGAWIIERPSTAPLEQQDAAVAEILVVGRRTQNADIRRFESDVQPYSVATKQEIRRAHRENVDQFFASRVTPNTQLIPVEWSLTGNTYSQINLRGLDASDTLVLVDGRRMPSLPGLNSSLDQPDLNGIPLRAIERIEVLTGTAGGIHGFGALGGAVNIVLDRSANGVELFTSGGISSRGDAGHGSVEASYGFNSSDGRTRITAFAAYSKTNPLHVGERDYAARDRRMAAAFAPDLYARYQVASNSVGVTPFGPTLNLKPEYGGATIDPAFTFLPTGFSGDAAALAASLTAHAGQIDTSISAGQAASDLGPDSRSESLLFNARHRFDSGLELYADAIVSRRNGQTVSRYGTGVALMSPDSPANPFADFVTVNFPISQTGNRAASRADGSRYTAGLMAELPAGWRGTFEAGFGGYAYYFAADGVTSSKSTLLLSGDPTDLDTNPFGDWNAFQNALTTNRMRIGTSATLRNHFEDFSLRVAGPLFDTAAGPTTLTLLAERRKERIATARVTGFAEIEGTRTELSDSQPGRMSAETSLYAEFRAPVLSRDTHSPLLRGLEVQLAIRRDDQRNEIAQNILAEEDDLVILRPKFVDTAYTVGAKINPSRWLMMRASYATGGQPPIPDAMRILIDASFPSIPATDPRRGNQSLGDDGPLIWRGGGNEDLEASRATTIAVGAVFTPRGDDGPTFAVDYSRIRRTGDPIGYSLQEMMDHEELWPERVTRAALTEADRALGYTAGRVTVLDDRLMNGARREVDAFDARTEWPFSLFGGRLRIYADATYHKSNRDSAILRPAIQRAGFLDGPLRWRANGGFDWSNERLSVGANLQFFDGSRVYLDGTSDPLESDLVIAQGSTRIPSQRYLDIDAGWRFALQGAGGIDELGVDLGIVNALDTSPPRQTSLFLDQPGYSRYGDPRRRRFELVLNCRF